MTINRPDSTAPASYIFSTRVLLICGVVAGPLYVLTTMVQALTRNGFDIMTHRYTLLTAGEPGWIHQANMILVGVLAMAFSMGISRMWRTRRGSTWAPHLLALFGLAYVVGGLLTADPILDFPPDTTPDLVQTTLSGIVQNASRGISSLLLVTTSLLIAVRFAADGQKGLAWLSGVAIPIVFVSLSGLGRIIGMNTAGVAFLLTPWVYLTGLAIAVIKLNDGTARRVAEGVDVYRQIQP